MENSFKELQLSDPIAIALAVVSLLVMIIGTSIAYATLRRTPKLPKPHITPVCLTILGAETHSGHTDLPTYQSGMARMGFNRQTGHHTKPLVFDLPRV
ncbi:MAG: hypothetical protein JWO15_3387 [Sphingomonadales bacterium]|nr:hypothetical protein [Sphingomonadales bacterium]